MPSTEGLTKFLLALCLVWLAAMPLRAQEDPAEPAAEPVVEEAGLAAEGGDSGVEDEEAGEGEVGAKEGSIFADAWQALRTSQSHLGEGDGGSPLVGLVLIFLVVYVVVVLVVLTVWRRSHTPSFRRARFESMGDAGRWRLLLAYDIRRKLDAEIVLRIVRVEPEGTVAEVAYLVADQIRGRMSVGGEGRLTFPGLNPRNFWQKDADPHLELGFELIKPRDTPVALYLEGKITYAMGRKQGSCGELREVLEVRSATGEMPVSPAFSMPAEEAAWELPSGLGRPPPAAPAPPALDAPAVGDQALDEMRLVAERVGAGLQELERRQAALEERLGAPGGAGSDEALRREIREVEDRLGSDLRENIQVVMDTVQDVRAEVASLKALLNDLTHSR